MIVKFTPYARIANNGGDQCEIEFSDDATQDEIKDALLEWSREAKEDMINWGYEDVTIEKDGEETDEIKIEDY